MIQPEKINPDEVLAYLHDLGYYDIEPQQLKDFLHDLKRLIKYDQKHNCKYVDHYNENSEKDSSKLYDSLNKLSASEHYVSSINSSYSESCRSSIKCGKSNEGKSINDKLPLQKVYSSFIRPWNLPVHKEFSHRNKKNLDPVALYHHYKETWKKHKTPGEKNHSQLRWSIRSKMLGQEPQPRTTFSGNLLQSKRSVNV